MTSKNPKDSIKRTGELLLSGWKLLNSSCPICNTALLSKGENLRCPMCDLAVVKEADQAKMGKMENLPTPPAVAERKFEIEDDYYAVSGAEVPFASLEEAKKEYDLANKRMTLVSNKLGEKMMAGFSMLSTVCPSESCRGTPLVRLAGAPMVCVSCDREYLTTSLGDLITTKSSPAAPASPVPSTTAPPAKPAANNPAVTLTPASPAPTAAAPAEDPSFYLDMHNAPVLDLQRFAYNANDASTQISKRLMQGWALLDHCCQSAKCKGEVPLMRDLSGKEVCVQCSAAAASEPARTFPLPTVTTTANATARRTVPQTLRGADRAASTASSASSEEEQGSAGGAEASSEEEDDFSDSEAEAELWRQHLEARQAAIIGAVQTLPSRRAPTQAKVAKGASAKPASSRAHTQECGVTAKARVAQEDAAEAGGEMAEHVRALNQKLRQTVQQLSASTNTVQSTQLAELVAKLAGAIKAVQSLEC